MLALFYLLVFAFKPAAAHYVDLLAIPRIFWRALKVQRILGLIGPLAAAMLLLVGYASIRRPFYAHRKCILTLVYIGLSSVALYLLSSRAEIAPGLPLRYTLVTVAAATIATALFVADHLDAIWRRRLVVVAAVVIVSGELLVARDRISPISADVLKSFSFLRAADEFRKTCENNSALALQPVRYQSSPEQGSIFGSVIFQI